jgi:hypothetical protein
VQIAEMGDRSAERRAAEPQKDGRDLGHTPHDDAPRGDSSLNWRSRSAFMIVSSRLASCERASFA